MSELVAQVVGGVGSAFNALFGTQTIHVPNRRRVGSVVALGDSPQFIFFDTEIPAELPMGGVQVYTEHQGFGGWRTVDSYGAQPHDLTFHGELFTIQVPYVATVSTQQDFANQLMTAVARSQILDLYRRSGNVVPFRWDLFEWRVKVVDYVATVHHINHVSYTITMKILSDNTADVTPSATRNQVLTPPFHENLFTQFQNYAKAATTFIAEVGLLTSAATGIIQQLKSNPAAVLKLGVEMIPGSADVAGLILETQGALDAANSLLDTTHPQLTSDMTAAQPYETLDSTSFTRYLIPQTQATLTDLSAILAFMLGSYTQLDSSDPAIATSASREGYRMKGALAAMIYAMQQMVAPSSVPVITVENPDLYRLAAKYLGDPLKWKVIADANDLQTPRPVGVYNLKLPLTDNTPQAPGFPRAT